jgi:hypothetical protein
VAGGRAKLGIAVWHYLGPLSPSLANPTFHYPASGMQDELAASTAGAARLAAHPRAVPAHFFISPNTHLWLNI